MDILVNKDKNRDYFTLLLHIKSRGNREGAENRDVREKVKKI